MSGGINLLFRGKCKGKGSKNLVKNGNFILEWFLPEDYKQILYNMYIECVQGKRTVTKYTAEFLGFLSIMN